jgi:hypothetical protein
MNRSQLSQTQPQQDPALTGIRPWLPNMLTAASSPPAEAEQHKLGQPGTHAPETVASDFQ